MVEDERIEYPGWLMFTMHPLQLEAGHSILANGDLIDGGSYALELKILVITIEAVTLSYAGHVRRDNYCGQVTLPFVANLPIRLPLDERSGSPPLYAAWETSVRVAPGETAVLIIGQRSEDR
jgi:hypothetical protein